MLRFLLKSVLTLSLMLFLGSGIASAEEKAQEAGDGKIRNKRDGSGSAGKSEYQHSNRRAADAAAESTAAKIIDYRNKNGEFKTLDQLKEVQGVGEKKYEKMKDMLIM